MFRKPVGGGGIMTHLLVGIDCGGGGCGGGSSWASSNFPHRMQQNTNAMKREIIKQCSIDGRLSIIIMWPSFSGHSQRVGHLDTYLIVAVHLG